MQTLILNKQAHSW